MMDRAGWRLLGQKREGWEEERLQADRSSPRLGTTGTTGGGTADFTQWGKVWQAQPL